MGRWSIGKGRVRNVRLRPKPPKKCVSDPKLGLESILVLDVDLYKFSRSRLDLESSGGQFNFPV